MNPDAQAKMMKDEQSLKTLPRHTRRVATSGFPFTSFRRHSDLRKTLRSLSLFALLAGVLWLSFLLVHMALPGIRSGADQVHQAKLNYLAANSLFPKGARIRVAIFGDSQVLSGFNPAVLDTLSNGKVTSFNLGLPGEARFEHALEKMLQRDDVPTHVLLTVPWAETERPHGWQRLRNDDWLMQQCFPFRKLPRNATLFLLRSRSRGGLLAYYRRSMDTVQQMLADRGYHFIEGSSLFPSHSLPDNFCLDTDDLAKVAHRQIRPEGPVFKKLKGWMDRFDFQVFFVPTYVREGALSEARPNPIAEEVLKRYGIHVLGPDYWVFPNRLFSDPTHLNPSGAKLYTAKAWELLRPWCDAEAMAGSETIRTK